ncbi:PTPRJ phosphatase, partial [Rynchops niger]|nr:PTPRJ phosphatase [Rynchops niger]
FTEPSPVHDLKAEYVGVTSVKLKWSVSDAASTSYTYRIEVVNATNGASLWNRTSSLTEVEIAELNPGTLYNFTVFAAVNDSQTEGEGVSIPVYTKPSPVHDLKAEYVGVTSVNLKWSVSDAASTSYTYRIEVVNATNGASLWNRTSSLTEVEIAELNPGTLYNFTVFAAVNDSQTEGEGVSILVYTKPSPVHDLKAEYVGVTSVKLKWSVSDAASTSYTYRIEVVNATNGASLWNRTSSLTEVEIAELNPGTLYNFTVFAAVNDSQTEGEGVSILVYTKPSPVHDLKAEYVGVTSVKLKWSVSDAASTSYMYRIEVVNGTSLWNRTSSLTEVEIAELIPGTLYNFTVFAAVNDSRMEGEGVSIPVYT